VLGDDKHSICWRCLLYELEEFFDVPVGFALLGRVVRFIVVMPLTVLLDLSDMNVHLFEVKAPGVI
jgi:hypothetical protein